MGRWDILIKVLIVATLTLSVNIQDSTLGSVDSSDSGDFSEYLNSFAKYYVVYTGKPFNYSGSIQFDPKMNLKFSLAGRCGSFNNIYINKYYWDRGSESYREALIYHELGHCFLNREHTQESYKGYPISIMHQYSLADWIYLELKEAYIAELFTENIDLVRVFIDSNRDKLKMWHPFNDVDNFNP